MLRMSLWNWRSVRFRHGSESLTVAGPIPLWFGMGFVVCVNVGYYAIEGVVLDRDRPLQQGARNREECV